MNVLLNWHGNRIRIEFYSELRKVSLEDRTNHAALVWNRDIHYGGISAVDKNSMGQRYSCVQGSPEKALEVLTDHVFG